MVGRSGGAEATHRLLSEAANLKAALGWALAADEGGGAFDAVHALCALAEFTEVDMDGLFLAALAGARRVGDVGRLARVLEDLGHIALDRSDHDAARARYEEALPLYRQVSSVLGEANCIKDLGNIALARSDHDTARACYEEVLSLYRQTSSVLGEANCIQRLGDLALRRSDRDAARTAFCEALGLYERILEPYSIGSTHCRLARIADTDEERLRHLNAARAAWEEIDRSDLVAQLDSEFGEE